MIEVLEPGLLTSVQTAAGRPGWRHLGVPVGGAVDPTSARLANRLVGNPDDSPVLEITLTGPILRFTSPTLVAMTGAAFEAALDGLPLPRFEARPIRAGSALRIGGGDGARAYLGIAGGIVVEVLLGSAATDLRSGFGGLDGRGLRAGDRLRIGPASTVTGNRWTASPRKGPIRIVDGPHVDALPAAALLDTDWTVSANDDRTGVRLDGPELAPSTREVASMALPLGAVQVPPDGHPIVLLADRPVTGGYPVPTCVIRADVGRIGQLRPGDPVRFASVTPDEAREAYRVAEAALEALEPSQPPDDELGWTGALE